jgi:hypothetical protein
MNYNYGRDITYNFTLHNNGDPIELPVSGLISSRLYGPTTYPTRNQIDRTDTAGYIQEVTAWASGVNNDYSKDITFSGVIDSDPFSSNECDKFYIVTNFIQQESNPIEVFNVETVFIYKPDAYTNRISIKPSDLSNIESKLSRLRTDAQLANHITNAQKLVLRELDIMGINKKRVYDLSSLNDAVLYAALSSVCLSLTSEEETVWFSKYNEYKNLYLNILKQQTIPVDKEGDNDPSPNESTKVAPSFGTIPIRR